jgi:hypothetical protein
MASMLLNRKSMKAHLRSLNRNPLSSHFKMAVHNVPVLLLALFASTMLFAVGCTVETNPDQGTSDEVRATPKAAAAGGGSGSGDSGGGDSATDGMDEYGGYGY